MVEGKSLNNQLEFFRDQVLMAKKKKHQNIHRNVWIHSAVGVDSYVQFVLNTQSFSLTELNTPLLFFCCIFTESRSYREFLQTATTSFRDVLNVTVKLTHTFSFLQTAASKKT